MRFLSVLFLVPAMSWGSSVVTIQSEKYKIWMATPVSLFEEMDAKAQIECEESMYLISTRVSEYIIHDEIPKFFYTATYRCSEIRDW